MNRPKKLDILKTIAEMERQLDELDKDMETIEKGLEHLDAILVQWDLEEMLDGTRESLNDGDGDDKEIGS